MQSIVKLLGTVGLVAIAYNHATRFVPALKRITGGAAS